MYKPPHQQKNAFISKKKPQMASIEDVTAFPELITQVKKKEVQMDFKAKLETTKVVEETTSKQVSVVMTEKNKQQLLTHKIMSKLNDNYLKWKAEYIEEYGEDYYEHYYRFPNYDYEYFDKLDDKLERELELEYEKELQREMDADYVTEMYEEYEKE